MTTIETKLPIPTENEKLFDELCEASGGDDEFAMEFLLSQVSPDLIRDLIRQVKERMSDED